MSSSEIQQAFGSCEPFFRAFLAGQSNLGSEAIACQSALPYLTLDPLPYDLLFALTQALCFHGVMGLITKLFLVVGYPRG